MSPLKRKLKPPRQFVRKVKKKSRQFEVVSRRLGRWTRLSATGDRETRVRAYVDRHAHVHFALGEALQAEKDDFRCGAEVFDFRRLSDNPRSLGYWGVPAAISEGYRKFLGIEQLFEWQTECLTRLEKFPGFNIYTVPTSGGKSLVAEILILQRLLYEGKRALFIAPYQAICTEKVKALREAWGPAVVVGEIHGGVAEGMSYFSGDVDVAVCTVEKAHGILNRWLQETKVEISNQYRSPPVGTIVIDEFHQLLTDTSRGHLIEGLVVKLKLLTRKLEDENFRVVGLSATLPEIDRIAKWLNAEIYTANFRPVELCISAHVNNYKFLIPLSSSSPSDVAPPVVSSDLLTPRAEVPVDSLEFISHACSEISGNVLVFCASKSWCENTAISLAKKISDSSDLHRTALANALLHSPGGSSPGLHRCVLAGVAWHHGGLTSEQRGLIERGYRERHIRVICCTTTLAAGVNLGGCTQRVIIRSMAVLTGYPATSDHIQQRERLLQMAGRAGRTGSTSKGECFVCLDNRTQTAALRTLLEPMEIATSDELGHMNTASKRHYSKLVLECIGTGLIKKESEIEEELNRALLTRVRLWEKEWKELQEQRYAKVVEGELLLSPMGEAVGFSMMTIGDAEETQNELRMKLKNLKLDNDDFELLYLCVSINQVTEMPNMDERKFLPFIEHAGLTGSFMNTKNKRRWLTAFTLRTLLTCNDIQRLADQFEIPFSILMSLLTHSASHCATMVLFCERRKWHSLAAALSSLVPRLQYGLPPDIIPLTKIPGVFSARARALHSAGLVDVQAIAKADVREIAAAISRCTPVEHRVLEQHDAYLKKTAERIIRGAQKLLSPDQ